MSKLSLREIAQSQLDSTPVIDGQLIVCLDTGNAYRDTSTAHVKIGSDLEVVSDLPLAPLAEKLYYLKPDKLYVFLGGNWTLLNDKTIDLDESIAKLPAGTTTDLNDDVEIITQDTDFTQSHYYRRKLVVLWEYIKTKAQDFFAAKDHKHKKADITDFPTSMPASDVYPWAKEATKPSYTKAEVGLGNVDNTADADKTVKRAATAGTADNANSVAWENVNDKPTTFPAEAHNHDDRYYTEAEVNSKLNGKVDNTEAGANGLLSKLSIWTATPTDDTYFMRQDTGGTNQFGLVKFSTIWNYIKSKADGTYQPKGSYAASDHNHDERYYTEAEVDGKLSSHTHYSISTIADNRNTNTTPDDYKNTLIFQGLKFNDKIGSPSSNLFSYLLGLRGWADASGGDSHELAFNNTGVYWRHGASEWSGWSRIYNENYHPNADYATTTGSANALSGLSSRSSQGWGVQTGTFVHGECDSTGGDFAFRRDCPNAGQLSMIIDGRFYQNEGNYRVLDESDISGIRTRADTDVGVPLAKSTIDGSVPWAGAGTNTDYANSKSMIGSSCDGGQWYNVLSVRHRNGASDGNNYGMLLFSHLTNLYDTLWYRKQSSGGWTDNRNILDSTNYSSYSLPLSGGTLSGNIHFADIGNVGTSSGITWGGSTDGAGIYYQTTGADQGNLVLNLTDDYNCFLRIAQNGNFKSYFSPNDGNFHGNVNGTADVANFAKETYISQYKTVNLTDLDQNTWYPVTGDSIPYNGLRRFKCNVQLNSGSKPNWSTHSSGFTAVVDLLCESSGWGTTNMLGMVLTNDQYWINDYNNPPVGYSQMSAGSIPVWWLRGGGSYRLATDYDITWTIRKSTYTNNGQTASPTTTYPGVYVNRSTIVANLNGNASTSDIATTGVRDYNNTNNTIRIGWSGADLDASTLAYIAGYTSDMKIHTASKDGVRSWIGLGNAAYKNVRSLSNVGPSGWANQSTDDNYVPTMAFMAFWNGAYGGTSSNLQYCDRGRFGTIVTKNSGDYAPASGSNNYVRVWNSGSNGSNDNLSINDLAKQHFAMAMVNNATDNPLGGKKWIHAISMAWNDNNNANWVSQIALGVHDSNGMWYRTNQGATVGADWRRVYDTSYHPNADKATSADYLNFTHGNEINFTGTPQNNTVYFGHRDSTINEYRFCKSGGTLASIAAASFNGKATSAGTADSATTSNGVKDYNDGNRTIQIGFAGSGLNTSNLNYIAGYTDNGTKIKDVSKDVLTSWIGLGNYLPLSGGVVTGQIKKDTGGSWIGDRDRVLARSHYPGDWAYGAVAGIATKSGFWTMGALGGWEDLVFNYSTDSNYSAGNNSTSQVRLPAQAGTIITSATIGSQTVNRAEYLANDSAYMRMHWNGQSGQPTWLWGGNDASNMYVWNPSNFSVNYANSAGNGTADFQTKVTSDGQFGAVRFNNGVQICWFTMNNTRNKTFLLPFADTNYAIAFSGGYCWLDVDSRTTTGFTTSAQFSGYENSYIAIGRWK